MRISANECGWFKAEGVSVLYIREGENGACRGHADFCFVEAEIQQLYMKRSAYDETQ